MRFALCLSPRSCGDPVGPIRRSGRGQRIGCSPAAGCGIEPADALSADHQSRWGEALATAFQQLRASCETDWFERFPAHAVAGWLGHFPLIAARRGQKMWRSIRRRGIALFRKMAMKLRVFGEFFKVTQVSAKLCKPDK
jgi:hypothetical protein